MHWTLIRLSSMGDIVLAFRFVLTAREALRSGEIRLTWVVSQEYTTLLHALGKRFDVPFKVLGFDRSESGGLKWIRFFWREVLAQPHTTIIDLHGTLRSRMARVVWVWARLRGFVDSRWVSISKQRLRYWGKRLGKKRWPEKWAPMPWRKRYVAIARTALRDVGFEGSTAFDGRRKHALRSVPIRKKIGVVPSSRWSSKEWGLPNWRRFFDQAWVKNVDWVLLGRVSDVATEAWARAANELKVPFADMRSTDASVTGWENTFYSMDRLDHVLGVDTGLIHVAELLGIPTTVLYGPTTPDLGFGPEFGKAVGVDLGCRPCGRDGRHCWRFFEPYACWNRLELHDIELK